MLRIENELQPGRDAAAFRPACVNCDRPMHVMPGAGRRGSPPKWYCGECGISVTDIAATDDPAGASGEGRVKSSAS